MKYNLMGQVCKDEYYISGIYRTFPFKLKDVDVAVPATEIIERIIKRADFNFNYYMSSKCNSKLQKQTILVIHEVDTYEKFGTIETDRTFSTGDVIKINDKEYEATYEYNKDSNLHELYLDYVYKIETDDNLKQLCEDKLLEINKLIEQYNEEIDEKQGIKEKQETIKSQNRISAKIKNWFKRGK